MKIPAMLLSFCAAAFCAEKANILFILADHLINFMKRHRDQPMFLYHAMCLPHTPFVTTPDEPGAKTHMERHKAMVRYLDKQVGRLVAAIDELGLRERDARQLYEPRAPNRWDQKAPVQGDGSQK